MAVIPIIHSDNHVHDRCPLNVSINQLFNQKSDHHQKIIQTRIGFDGNRSDCNLPISNTVHPTDSVLDRMHHFITAEVLSFITT
jgi:hypothetical protein